MGRPTFHAAWSAFMDINIPVDQVGRKIGGKVQQNIATRVFENAYPIRISYVLNKSGTPIRRGVGYQVVSGADGSLYLHRVGETLEYLSRVLGKPDTTASSPEADDFAGMRGILVVTGRGWANARGHVTLWDGRQCADACHLLHDPDNGPFTPETASIWTLP